MKNKEGVNKFSTGKLLLTILCTTMVTIFISFTIMFIQVFPTWALSEVVLNLERDSDALSKIGNEMEERFESAIEKDEQGEGENHPDKGILLYYLTNRLPTQMIVNVYAKSLLIGIALGTIIYIIAVQNVNEKKMIIELVIAFMILIGIIMILNVGYEASINKGINELNPEQVKYSTYIYDIESNEYLIIQYIVVAAIIYIANMIKQKILTNKLNKELNKK